MMMMSRSSQEKAVYDTSTFTYHHIFTQSLPHLISPAGEVMDAAALASNEPREQVN